tara:strand:- start:152 stop:604 length:453 start_codon:yes stop_codon:yes gene_type:complete
MKFIERIKLIEKRKRKKTEDMTNRQSDDDELPDGPEPTPQATKSNNDAESELDQEDTMEMSEPGKVDASKKRRMEKEALDPSGGDIEVKEKKDKDWIQKAVNPDNEGACTPTTKSTCTPQRKALAKTFKKMGKKRDAEVVSKKEKAAAKK